jgi:hypothetical protein
VAFDLLRYLDDIVKNDRGPPGFRGTVCVAVKGRGFWLASFADVVTTSISSTMPDVFDVAVGFREDEIDALLDPARDVPGIVTGDRELFLRFVRRYVKSRSALDVRLER